MSEARCQFARLPNLGTLIVTGPDAERFLAAQLSQTPPTTGTQRAPLAAWHDAKGRVQALFRIVHRDDGYLLVTHASVVDAVAAALRRYVLRSDVTIETTTPWLGAALLGECDSWMSDRGIEIAAEVGATATSGDAVCVRLGASLVHVLAPIKTIEQLAGELPPGRAADAELAEIRLGLPTVSAEIQGQLLPQMLNLDTLGGVAFDKGCYPGQEIIARTQHRGTIKRRLARFTCASGERAPAPGDRIVDGDGNRVGLIVRAAATADGSELLAVVELAAMGRQLHVEDAERQTLSPASAA